MTERHFPRELTGGRWQGASGRSYASRREAELDTLRQQASASPTSTPARRKRYIWIKVGAILILLGLLLVKADIWRSTGNRELCGWTAVMIEAPASVSASGQADGEDCSVVSNGVRASFRLYSTNKGIIDTGVLQTSYQRSTGGAAIPSPDLSWSAALSLVRVIWDNRLPMVVYEAPNHRQGYILAPISDRVVLGGYYVSERPESVQSIQDAVRLHMNPDGQAWRLSLLAKLGHAFSLIFLLIPLGFVLGARAVFKWFDRWWDLHTSLGLVLYCTIVPGILFLWAWNTVRIGGWGTVSFGAMLLAVIGVGQVLFNLGRNRSARVPLTPFNAEKLEVFNVLKVTNTAADIAGAEIPMGRSIEAQIWVPRRAHCPACDLRYAVYVPSGAERSIQYEVKSIDDIPLNTRQELYVEAFQAAPQLVNGCIRCGHRLAEASSIRPVRSGPYALSVKSVLVAAACLPLAVLLALRGGLVVGAVEKLPVIGSLLADVVEDFAGLLILALAAPGLYFLWRVFAGLADLHTSRRSGLHRMSACPREGIVFEDIFATRDMTCPSCKEDREPMRAFRVLGAR